MAYFTQSEYGKYVSLQNVSGSGDPASGPEGGVYLFASGTMTNAKLYMQNEGGVVTDVMKTLDIDAFDALGGAGLHQSQDHFVFSDNGTEKKITFSNLQDAVFADVSGDATIAAGGALTIAAAAVEHGMLAEDIISGQAALGGASVAQADLLMLDDGPGAVKKVTFSNFEDSLFGNVSGDATIAAGGALTIAAQAVENSMLADDAVGADELAANAVVNASIASNAAIDMDKLDGGSLASSLSDLAQGDLMYAGDIDDSNNIKSITFSNLEDAIFGNVSGDATIAAGGALTIGANAIQTGMVHDDVATELAGNGLAASSGVLAVGVDDSSIELNSDALRVKAGGIATAMLADDAVDADKLAANAVVEASIVDNAVTLAKMAGITRGSLILGDSSGDPSLLGKGTAAQFLQSDGTDPSYVTISGDATIAAGGALTIAAQAVENSMLADDAVGADELAANAVVNASVASNAAIVATKLNFNVDFGGNVQFGTQTDDAVVFGGTIALGGNVIGNAQGEATISMDNDQNVALAAAATVGGGYGSSGVTMSAAGAISADGALTIGADGAGVNSKFFGGAANEHMSYDAGNHVLYFVNGSSATLLTLGGDATTEYALDIANGSDNINKVRAAAFVTYSDESLKSDVASMSNTALDTVMSLNGVEFTWKDSGERDFGFIAQDVQNVLPKAVHVAEDGVQGVDYSRLTSVLVEAVKAQQVQIEELKAILKK